MKTSILHDVCDKCTSIYPLQPHLQHGYRPRTTEERMHLAALQHSQPPMGLSLVPPGYPGYPGHPGQGMHMQQGRRATAMKKQVRWH